ncbi:MAG TPA: hypothetical protein VLH79_05455 [Chthonomonadales bacterium]|nr:hypothetical protein [Chthonomonadales bacterium]
MSVPSVTRGWRVFARRLLVAGCVACMVALASAALANGRRGATIAPEDVNRTVGMIAVIMLASLGVFGYYQYQKMLLLKRSRSKGVQKPPPS